MPNNPEPIYSYRPAYDNGEPAGFVVQAGPARPLFDVPTEGEAARAVARLNSGCPECPHAADEHDNATGCQAEGCDCQERRGYDD